VQLAPVAVVEGDAFLGDVHEEIAAVGEAVVHLLEGVDDEVDGGVEGLGDDQLAQQAILGAGPELDAIGEALVADDDEQVDIRAVALGGVGLVDEGAARVGAVEDDLGDAALLLPVVAAERDGVAKLLEDDLDDPFQLALLVRGKMIYAGAHRMSDPPWRAAEWLRHGSGWHPSRGKASDVAPSAPTGATAYPFACCASTVSSICMTNFCWALGSCDTRAICCSSREAGPRLPGTRIEGCPTSSSSNDRSSSSASFGSIAEATPMRPTS